jgi:hypothetical protein
MSEPTPPAGTILSEPSLERFVDSPITTTYETWPLAGAYHLRWGRDGEGEMWVAVENENGACKAVLPYTTYLQMEAFRPVFFG